MAPATRSFYSNVCMLLGSFNRGLTQRHPFVTLPASKVGLELASVFRNLGIIKDFEMIQKHAKARRASHYPVWPAGKEPATSAELRRHPAMFLKLWLRSHLHQPLHLPETASLLQQPAPYVQFTPESIRIISKPTLQQRLRPEEVLKLRKNYGPGLLLVSSDRGLVTDMEVELYKAGGVVLGHVGLPMAHVAQIRAMLREKHSEDLHKRRAGVKHPGGFMTPLKDFDMHGRLRTTVSERLQPALPAAVLEEQVSILQLDVEQKVEEAQELLNKSREDVVQLQREQMAVELLDTLPTSSRRVWRLPEEQRGRSVRSGDLYGPRDGGGGAGGAAGAGGRVGRGLQPKARGNERRK